MILAIDVGGGTQDILLYREGIPVENCVQLVLPAQTVIVAGRIREQTAMGRDICLVGSIMGGGASVKAIQEHLQAGSRVFAIPGAARTINDDLKRVCQAGIQLVDSCPGGAVPIELKDIDLDSLRRALDLFGVTLPEAVAVAVLDHGESIGESNRRFRFRHWERFILDGGRIADLTYGKEIPAYLTRMKAIRDAIPGAVLMDTGTAAVRGALCDPEVQIWQAHGVVVVNAGNQHTIGFLVKQSRVWGMFEHHTVLMDTAKLNSCVDRLREGTLTNNEVYNDGGHGCFLHPGYKSEGKFRHVVITGPRRAMADSLGYHKAVPFGNMMLSGSFGLVAAALALRGQELG